MSEPTWRRAKQIFHEALEKSGPERARFVAAACGNDDRLLAQVQALLSAHEEAGEFMASPTSPGGEEVAKAAAGLAAAGPPEGPGTRIGPYKLLQGIGEGGMGVVYMAEQEHPIRRRVALKIIKLGMDTKEVIARFEAERQALALMDHPGIAKVLDAGATETGRPYFVMELVKGLPITEYSDANRSSTRERLELFVDVCRAIQHAHEKGVVHRDIKPSNVLVTLHDGTPVAKVIDFGIAKAMNQPLTEKTLFTAYGEFAGTPAYMSPEQATLGGLEIDRRCDIYALGVLLYELLTGTTPFEPEQLRSRAFLEIMRIIREDDPPTPSARLSTLGDRLAEVASRRQIEPHALAKLVRGDLDWIVTRALEKDRRRRYDSATALADDIARHFRHEPVSARRPSAGYRARKFARRRRGPLVAAAGIGVAILLGAGVAQVGGFARVPAAAAGPPSARLMVDLTRRDSDAGTRTLPTRDPRYGYRYSNARRGFEVIVVRNGRVRHFIPAPPAAQRTGLLAPNGRALAAVRVPGGAVLTDPGVPAELRLHSIGGPEEGRVVHRWDPDLWSADVFGWSPDGTRVWTFTIRRDYVAEIASVEVVSGRREVLKTIAYRSHTQAPSLSPDGRFIAYHDADRPSGPPDIFVLSTDGSQEIRIEHPARDSKPLFAPDGSGIVFESDRERGRDLWFLPLAEGRPAGEARAVWRDTGPFGMALHFAGNGSLYYYFQINASEVYTAEIDLSRGVVGPPQPIPARSGEINDWPAFSPDGRFLAYSRGDARRVVLRELAGGNEREYPVPSLQRAASISFCADGRTLVVAGPQPGGFAAYRVDLERGGAEPVLTALEGFRPVLCVGDSDEVVYVMYGRASEESRVVRRSVVTGAESMVYRGPPPARLEIRVSPDGRSVAARTLPETAGIQMEGEARLFVFPAVGGEATEIPGSWTGVHGFAWLPNGRELLVARLTDGEPSDSESPELTFWRVPVAGGTAVEAGRMRLPRARDGIYGSANWAIHPDGSRIAFARNSGVAAQIWAIENLLPFIQSGATAPVRGLRL